MNDRQAYVSRRAQALRVAFDAAFALAPNAGETKFYDFLAIGLGANVYALQLNEISGLFSRKKITRVPSQISGLLGIAGFRGLILPVYDLGVLLGHAPLENPHWIAIVGNTGIAIAFEKFDGHLRIPQESIAPNTAADGSNAYTRNLIRTDDGIRAVITLPLALTKITEPELNGGSTHV